MKRSSYKKFGELSAWDLDPNSRKYINQSTPSNRRLKKKLLRIERKRLNREDKEND